MTDWKKIFTIIWTGQLFSTLSSSIVGYAVVFWLSIETKSAEVLAFATIAHMLPALLLGPFTGVLIDRWNRRLTMIFADLFIAVCSAVMGVMFLMGDVDLPFIYGLLVMRSIGSAFHVPAMQASVPLIAPESELMRIAGINQVIQSVGTIAGPALAALLISVFEMTHVMFIDVLGAVIGSASLFLVKIPNPEKNENAPEPHIFREMKEGLYEISKKTGLLWLFVFTILATFFIMPVAVLFPLMTIDHFSGGTYHMSVVEVAWGAGMLTGGALLGIKKFKVNEIVLINLTYVLLGITFALSGLLSPNGFWLFVTLTLFGGISMSMYSSAFTVVLQTNIDPAALGRVFSIYGSITLLPSMIGLLQTGYIADEIGVTNAFVISGIAVVIVGFGAFFVPAIRKMIHETSMVDGQKRT